MRQVTDVLMHEAVVYLNENLGLGFASLGVA